MTVVWRPGPPPVNLKSTSKICSELMIDSTITTASELRMAGSVTCRKACHDVAPSIFAAR